MQIIGQRLQTLQENIKLSQTTIAKMIGTSQVSINRYENNSGALPLKTLLWDANYFDVF